MRVLIVGLNYLPESTSIGPYTAELAEYLLDQGHQVQAIVGFPMAPQWRVWDGYRGKLFMREFVNGVPLFRSYLYVPKQPRKALNRILFDLSFSASALVSGAATKPCDVVVGISPPLQGGLAALLLSRLKRAKFFLHIQDLVPAAAVATGMLSERSLAARAASRLESLLYERADRIGVICDGFAEHLMRKGVPREKIALLPNYVDLDFVRPYEGDNSFRMRHGLDHNKFLVMYSGSVALKQGLETFVDAAAELRDHGEVELLIVGEGPYLSDLKDRVTVLGLSNLRFLPLQPRDTLPQQLSAADALAITQRRVVTDIVFPGKLLYYMAAGRPIVASVNADSETGRFLNKHQVGVVAPPEDPISLAGAILRLKEEGAKQMGARAREVAEQYFDRNKVLPSFAGKLQSLLS